MIAPDGWRPMTPAEVETLPGGAGVRLPLTLALHWSVFMAARGERDAAFTLERTALGVYDETMALEPLSGPWAVPRVQSPRD